jgi:SnoaL-like domain
MTPETRRASEHDCARLVTRFFARLDATDYGGVWDLMAPTGVWRRSGQILDARETFLSAMAKRPVALVIRHLVSNIVVEFPDDRSAMTEFCLTVFRFIGDPGGKPAPISLPSAVSSFHAKLVLIDSDWWLLDLGGETLFA